MQFLLCMPLNVIISTIVINQFFKFIIPPHITESTKPPIAASNAIFTLQNRKNQMRAISAEETKIWWFEFESEIEWLGCRNETKACKLHVHVHNDVLKVRAMRFRVVAPRIHNNSCFAYWLPTNSFFFKSIFVKSMISKINILLAYQILVFKVSFIFSVLLLYIYLM